MPAIRYSIPSLASRRTTARAVLALFARGARPLVFTRTSADASVLASAFGLPLLDPGWPAERTFAQLRAEEPPRGLVATLASVTGWRARLGDRRALRRPADAGGAGAGREPRRADRRARVGAGGNC